MLKNIVNSLLSNTEYEIRRKSGRHDSAGFSIYQYRKPDGSFDYERYRQIQQDGNLRKIEQVWAVEENIAYLANYIQEMLGQPQFGICHGTRRGKEQEWFRKHLNCKVIGTEISDTATDFPHTIQWDFHEVKPEWINATDFIYSNSFDHSYDPEKCLNAWMSCIRPGGLCILEHSSNHEPQSVRELDPFGADYEIMPYLITSWASGTYGVRQLLSAPTLPELTKRLNFIVIQKF